MKKTALAFGIGAAFSGAGALAQQNTIDLGAVDFQINSTSPNLSGRFTPAGLNLTVGNDTTLFFAYTRQILDQFDVELAGGIPPKFNVTAKGPAMLGSVPYSGQMLASANAFTPAVFVDYRFLDRSSAWQPYIGIGVNYTNFYNVSSTAANNAINGGFTSLGLSDSWGVAGHIGLRYRLPDNFSVNFGITAADVKSHLTLNTFGIARSTNIDFRPTVFTLSAGYSF